MILVHIRINVRKGVVRGAQPPQITSVFNDYNERQKRFGGQHRSQQESAKWPLKKATHSAKNEKTGIPKRSQDTRRSRAPVPGTDKPKKPQPTKGRGASDFPIVGIGVSAGGLEAFEQFFNDMAPDSGMAFVLIQHLDPTHKSILADLIRSFTRMAVTEVRDNMKVEPDNVYVIPPNSDMAILHGRLHLLEPSAPRGLREPIDSFFRSLLEDRKEKAICVVLSGSGTEGTLGFEKIKGQGGMVMVQDPSTAKTTACPGALQGPGWWTTCYLPTICRSN